MVSLIVNLIAITTSGLYSVIYVHMSRLEMQGLTKMVPQGTVQKERRKGRQKKRWEDNISEWTGLGLGEALRKAEDRDEWRKVVARPSLMP